MPKNSEQEVIATTMMGVIQETFKKMSSLEFSREPEFTERDIIEYQSRMRANGMGKFNAPCFVSSISFYVTQKDLDKHNACGAMVLYIEEECAGKLLNALGYKDFDDDDEEMVLDNCGEFCNTLGGTFKNELASLGYKDIYISAPIKNKNAIQEGVEFPYSQYKYYETCFDLWKKKALVVDVTMAPIPGGA